MRGAAVSLLVAILLFSTGVPGAQLCLPSGDVSGWPTPQCPTLADSVSIVVFSGFPNTCYFEPIFDSIKVFGDTTRIFSFVKCTTGVLCFAIPVWFVDTLPAENLPVGQYFVEVVTTIDSGIFAGTYSCLDSFLVLAMGDVNADRTVASADIIHLVNHVFRGGDPPCGIMGDVNCDHAVTSTDVIYLVRYIFKAGPKPVEPCPST